MEKRQQFQNQNISINGKAQVIELLNHLSSQEKKRILSNIRLKNPQLAKELNEQSFSFATLNNLLDSELKELLSHIPDQILGLAIKLTATSFQKRCLKLIPRDRAHEVFAILKTPFSNEAEKSKRAQEKIIQSCFNLTKRGALNLRMD